MGLDRSHRRVVAHDREHDPVAHVESGILAGLLNGTDDVAGETLGFELRRDGGVEHDEVAVREESHSCTRVASRQYEFELTLVERRAVHDDGFTVEPPVTGLRSADDTLHVFSEPGAERPSIDVKATFDPEVAEARVAEPLELHAFDIQFVGEDVSEDLV
jgi:hypothetical protein